MKTVRESFVKEFGERNAKVIESCAKEHGNGINNKKKGSDPFKNALLIVIGYECVSKEIYFKYHKFDSKRISPYRFEKWCKEKGELNTHDGDCDYLALICGVYNKFIPEDK